MTPPERERKKIGFVNEPPARYGKGKSGGTRKQVCDGNLEHPSPCFPLLRGQKVILDADLGKFYGVSTKRLNEQIRRNNARFPEDFTFQLTLEEKAEVVANCDHLSKLKFSPALSLAFTEHGAIMAATVLNSPRAIEMSVLVVRAFIKLREVFMSQGVSP